MDHEQRKRDFLTHYIFNPLEVWLPESYEQILLELNVWPSTMLMPQKKALLSRKSFNLGSTVIHTKAKKLKFKMSDGSFAT